MKLIDIFKKIINLKNNNYLILLKIIYKLKNILIAYFYTNFEELLINKILCN